MTNILKARNALLFASLLGLSACAKQGSDLSGTAPADTTKKSQAVLPDDVTEESAFNPNDKAETDLVDEPSVEAKALTSSERQSILAHYDYVDPNRTINTQALGDIMIYFNQHKNKIPNQRYVSVIDFTQKSSKARFHIIDMTTGKVWSIHVAHGKGSDANGDGYADKFSNQPDSRASSLGYYLTGSTYNGKHGLSLKLDGLSSTNSNVRGRAIVIHGADYVHEDNSIQGRSWGCPAVSMALRDKVISMLKNGSLIYAIGNSN
ncbi:MAG: murein L,D-transpeptidase catalytic domain family protein [Bdellovibrio sp.]